MPRKRAVYYLFYVAAWMVVAFIVMLINYNPHTAWIPQWIGHMGLIALCIPACYYTAYILTPRYLYSRKITAFIFYFLFITFLNTVFTFVLSLYIYGLFTGIHVLSSSAPLTLLSLFGVTLLLDTSIISISCIIKVVGDHYFMEQKMLEIEKEKVSTELNFLRSQVNPHFLFNVMNTIYFQIDKANADARVSVEKFSEMLRYQLYECTTDKIPISKELHYIKNYVDIQTLRMERGSDIQLQIDEGMRDFMIAPLLILPIVENAFKHVSNFKEPGRNKIYLTIANPDAKTLVVDVINTFDPSGGQKHLMETGGLGVQNLRRRLELLYPGRHGLTIDKEEDLYHTVLKIQYMYVVT
ncbi:MAG: histidine kinase [Bacteroidetes bacterium]|nr:histidine kinase [Bacteroidota bacterium]